MSCSNKFKSVDKVVRKHPCTQLVNKMDMFAGKEFTVIGYDSTFNRLMLKEFPLPSREGFYQWNEEYFDLVESFEGNE